MVSEVLLELGMEIVPQWECLFVHREGLFLSVYDDVKNGWKREEIGSHVEDIDETC